MMIRSFHEDKRAAVLVKRRCSNSFTVRNMVGKGCTIALVHVFFQSALLHVP